MQSETVLASSQPTVCHHLLFLPRTRYKTTVFWSSLSSEVNAGNVTALAQMTASWRNRSMITTCTTALPRWKHPAVLQVSIKTVCCIAWTHPTSSFQDPEPNQVSQLARTITSSTHHTGNGIPSYTKFPYYSHHSHYRARILTIKYNYRQSTRQIQ
jgi:hypothetical protein